MVNWNQRFLKCFEVERQNKGVAVMHFQILLYIVLFIVSFVYFSLITEHFVQSWNKDFEQHSTGQFINSIIWHIFLFSHFCAAIFT